MFITIWSDDISMSSQYLVLAWWPSNSHYLTLCPDSKVHGAKMGSTWVLSAPDGPNIGPMNLAIRDAHPYLCHQNVSLGHNGLKDKYLSMRHRLILVCRRIVLYRTKYFASVCAGCEEANWIISLMSESLVHSLDIMWSDGSTLNMRLSKRWTLIDTLPMMLNNKQCDIIIVFGISKLAPHPFSLIGCFYITIFPIDAA